MSFNPHPSKQAQEIFLVEKLRRFLILHYVLITTMSRKPHIKTPRAMFLDPRIKFEEHLKVISLEVNKNIGLLRKLQKTLPSPVLITIHKALVRPHLDYGDITYDEACNKTFYQKFEAIQYNASLVLLGAIKGSSREKFYHELGLESLQSRHWYRKLCLFYKIFK